MENNDEISGEGNSLDYGARIYDSRMGRWFSLDPLMTKYPNLSPYNFVDNSPIYCKDGDGKDIIVLCAPAKAKDFEGKHPTGHQAVLIGNEKDGWTFYSFDGHDEEGNDGKTSGKPFKTLKEFANSEYNTYKDNYDDGQGLETSHRTEDGKVIQRFEEGYKIATNKETDKEMKSKVSKYLESHSYGSCGGAVPIGPVCTSLAEEAFKAAGLKSGKTSIETNYTSDGIAYKTEYNNWFPNKIQKAIESANKGTDVDNQLKRTTKVGNKTKEQMQNKIVEGRSKIQKLNKNGPKY